MNNLERVERALEVLWCYGYIFVTGNMKMRLYILFTKSRFKCFCNLYMEELALLDTPGDCEIYIHSIQYRLDKYANIEELKEHKDLYSEYLEIIKPRKGKECSLNLFVETDY